jgi:hypothetical protein
VTLARDHARDVWLPLWYQELSLDLKLGLRMLAKYPWLTIGGGLAMACGIGVGVAGYEGLSQLVDPTLPLEDGRRIVGVRTHNVQTNRSRLRTAFEFARWRHDVTLIEEIGIS